MYDKLEERTNEFMESNEGARISYQLYNKEQNLALILAIMNPLYAKSTFEGNWQIDFS